MYNVAEVCSQDVVDIDHSVTDVWKLTDEKRAAGEQKTTTTFFPFCQSYLKMMRSGAQYPGEVCAGSQLGQCAADGVAGVRHGSISAGRVRQRVGQRRPLVRQAVFQFDGPLLENLQGGAHALQSLLGLSHGYDMQGKEEGEQEVRLLGRARQCFMVRQ